MKWYLYGCLIMFFFVVMAFPIVMNNLILKEWFFPTSKGIVCFFEQSSQDKNY